eukprot:3988231-Amphidinium_carterae.1
MLPQCADCLYKFFTTHSGDAVSDTYACTFMVHHRDLATLFLITTSVTRLRMSNMHGTRPLPNY